MWRARVIFSAPSDPRELPVTKPRSCGVQRSSSRTCRTLRAGRFGHLTSTVLMPEEQIITATDLRDLSPHGGVTLQQSAL